MNVGHVASMNFAQSQHISLQYAPPTPEPESALLKKMLKYNTILCYAVFVIRVPKFKSCL